MVPEASAVLVARTPSSEHDDRPVVTAATATRDADGDRVALPPTPQRPPQRVVDCSCRMQFDPAAYSIQPDGVRCIQLSADNRCGIFGQPGRP